jgi:NAD(P)-dependent dehydrogenase (short-subunit alcohol dehydrogenase family)
MKKGRTMLKRAIWAHVLTSRYGVPLMVERKTGLVVEVTDGDFLGWRGNLFYDLAKVGVVRLAYSMAADLRDTDVSAVAVTPGFLRSEAMLDRFGVTEENWREHVKKDRHFAESETPWYVGRAVAALAADSNVSAKSGRVFASWTLAREYGSAMVANPIGAVTWTASSRKSSSAGVRKTQTNAFCFWSATSGGTCSRRCTTKRGALPTCST